MPITINLVDRAMGATDATTWNVRLAEPKLTGRDLLRKRIERDLDLDETWREAREAAVLPGEPAPARRRQARYGPPAEELQELHRAARERELEVEVARAERSFAAGAFLLCVGERQVHSLDDEVSLDSGEEVTFLRLVPLAGG